METNEESTPSGTPNRTRYFKWSVEIILAVMIAAIVLYVITPKYSKCSYAPITAAKTQIQSMKTALDAFEVDMGAYPATAEGLDPLVAEPRNSQNHWRGPYLDTIPCDPWGNAYRYVYPGKKNPETYEITSAGKDGKFDTRDDLTLFNLAGQ